MIEYRFFFCETEFQLMSFVGTDPEDWDEEDLIGVYSTDPIKSWAEACVDVREDMVARNILSAKFDVDFRIG